MPKTLKMIYIILYIMVGYSKDANISVERKLNADGSENPKYIDVLDEDKPIAAQKFVCVSFISPEKILKQKEHFFFEQFLNKWEINKSMEKFNQFLNFVSYKYKLNFDKIIEDFKDFLDEEKSEIMKSGIDDDYKTFIDQNEEQLENSFNTTHHFQTSTRGIKVRGVYPTLEEAELRCKLLRELDPNHDVFVGPVGLWMPWDPEAYKTGRVEYMEEELNALMNQKNKNEEFAKSQFDERVKQSKKDAIEHNIELANKNDITLTQTLDKDGNLVGVANMNTQEETLKDKDTISSADIRKELFEGDNIVTGKTDHGQSELISGPFATKK